MVDRLRSLSCTDRRRVRAPAHHARQPRLGHVARLRAGRQDAGLSGDGEARLRVRSIPHRLAAMARRPATRADRGVGPLALLNRLVAGRADDPHHRRQPGQRVALLGRREERPRAHAGRRRSRPFAGFRRRPRHLRHGPLPLASRALLGEARWLGRPPAHAAQRGQAGRRAPRRAGAVQLRRLERRDGLRLDGEAGRFRSVPQVPGGLSDPRRPAGLVRQRLPLPLEPAGLRRRGLRGGDGRLPRLHRLRAGLHRLD